jgi:uncharacterized protein YndB with AHSA1/START domain
VASDDPIVREIFIDASPEEVFPYLTRTDRYLEWMGLSAELDPRPGGIFRVEPNGRNVIRGEFLEVWPPTRLVFTWGFDEPGHPLPAGSTTVEVDLIRQGSGTLVRLVHRNLPPDRRDRHVVGWTHYLARLKVAVGGGDPGPDPYADPAVRHG